MKVNLTYFDDSALTVEEVRADAKRNYGNNVQVEVSPESSIPEDLLYFALQQISTHEQLSLYYNGRETYHKDIIALRSRILGKVMDILDSVIIDNENKVS
jgi:hypothetical protein